MMKLVKQRGLIISGALLIVIIMIGIVLLSRYHPNTISPPRLTLVFLDGATIHFRCLDNHACFKDVNLGDPVKSWKPTEFPLSLESAFYLSPGEIYTLISGTTERGNVLELVKINPEMSRVQMMDLSSSTWKDALFVPKLRNVVGGKMVFATGEGKIGVVQDNFTIKEIDLNHGITGFTDVDNSNLVAFSNGEAKDGSSSFDLSIVNVNTGDIQHKSFPLLPGLLLTVRSDLRYAYLVGQEDVGMYEIGTGKKILSIPGGLDFEGQANDQYHHVWYYYRARVKSKGEGITSAKVLDMYTLQPILNPDDLVKNEFFPSFSVAPFGDDLLIGTDSQVMVLTADHKIQNTYHLSSEIAEKDWVFLAYRTKPDQLSTKTPQAIH